MPLRIIAVGKLAKPWLEPAREFQKRISRFDRLDVLELPDMSEPAGGGAAQQREVIRREGERILKAIRPGEHLIALCVDSPAQGSEVFARRFETLRAEGKSLCFVVGGSLGLSEDVLTRSNERVSLSALTFPHQLARVVLLEQIYRAFKIIGNERYHK